MDFLGLIGDWVNFLTEIEAAEPGFDVFNSLGFRVISLSNPESSQSMYSSFSVTDVALERRSARSFFNSSGGFCIFWASFENSVETSRFRIRS